MYHYFWDTRYQSATGISRSMILFLIYVLTNFPEILINFDFFTSIPPSMKNRKNEEKFFSRFLKKLWTRKFYFIFLNIFCSAGNFLLLWGQLEHCRVKKWTKNEKNYSQIFISDQFSLNEKINFFPFLVFSIRIPILKGAPILHGTKKQTVFIRHMVRVEVIITVYS